MGKTKTIQPGTGGEEKIKSTLSEFWEKWEQANELQKVELVGALPLFGGGKVLCPLFSPSLINSYFEDLYLYIKQHEIFTYNNKQGRKSAEEKAEKIVDDFIKDIKQKGKK